MIVGIVGSEGAKFTRDTELLARQKIDELLRDASCVVSGACHLGGIDRWAIEQAQHAKLPWIEYPPATKQWTGGYKERNIQIAEASDLVVCITVKELPPHYNGMRFKLCYHCGTDDHVKSGGCWTVKYAQKLGKEGRVEVIHAP